MGFASWLDEGTEGFNSVGERLEEEAGDRLNIEGRSPDGTTVYVALDENIPLIKMDDVEMAGAELERELNSIGMVIGRSESYGLETDDVDGYRVSTSGSVRAERAVSQELNIPHSGQITSLYDDLSGVEIVLSNLEGEGTSLFDATRQFEPRLKITGVLDEPSGQYERGDPALSVQLEWDRKSENWKYYRSTRKDDLHDQKDPEEAREIIGHGTPNIVNSERSSRSVI